MNSVMLRSGLLVLLLSAIMRQTVQGLVSAVLTVKQAAQPKRSEEGVQATEPLAQLAEEQRQLEKEVAQALNEQRGEQPQPNANEQPRADEQPKAGEQPLVAQQVRETQQAQKELAQQAQELQKQVEQELGKGSAEAKQSQQTARLCES